MTGVPDPCQKSRSVRLYGGTMAFVSPELLIPQEFGKEGAVPTPQSDVYAFGFVIFQVREQGYGCQLSLCVAFSRSLQVKFHSVVSDNRRWCTTYLVDCARPNQKTPPLSDSPTRCGCSPNAAGMVRLSRDQRSGML